MVICCGTCHPGTYGRHLVAKPRIIRFRDQSTLWKPRWYMPELPVFQRRVGGRIALVVEATIYGRKVITYNLHLESRGGDDLRLRRLNEVLADCRKYDGRPPLVVAGDFNLNAGSGDATQLSARPVSAMQWD